MAITKVPVYSANMTALLCIVCGLLTWPILSKASGQFWSLQLCFATCWTRRVPTQANPLLALWCGQWKRALQILVNFLDNNVPRRNSHYLKPLGQSNNFDDTWMLYFCKFFAFTNLSKPFFIYIYIYIQGVPGGKDLTSGECSLGQTVPI